MLPILNDTALNVAARKLQDVYEYDMHPDFAVDEARNDAMTSINAYLAALPRDQQPATLRARIATLEALLQSCAEFIEPYVDVVDGAYGEPSPNAAMSLLSDIREVLPD